MAQLKITLVHGLVNRKPAQRETVRTLGLHKIGQSVVREDSPANRGLVHAVRHLVTVEEVD
ncbi:MULTISPECIES: 50S ribosomal protein L30 [Bifidobacterium]|jgi:large subunit ribosomal protein L30|uniref:Large ribosomal subunit protein uL30 n=1 Tax=Bifidobacterium tibiigranuli TaxID=2172043 RepID=A0A5N6S3Q0_9BIFI|nr:50S ribosomal protein L30 [Bifidobacterium tibiigranuli]KAE8129110.1 50S ribosomal protein L30 [Bifidobacterium tibiigranuli]KAE8129348.1 50S ribosomal protein L30 [Bifidobacterium tibiigranuli]MCH3975312.1 50S ribosomal protein L30 [Bifidobacterium tibiigranuli]MCH4203511.1 50S ribosomal protein L30 [Bifidobacterium tibiigranuli]MCH4273877.1 50S ribosomal protein L30 [Bifidobacterium tibiigranuli]